MQQAPIMNPPNPYVGALRVFPGTLVKVSGRPRPNATRFAINFQTGPSLNPRDDLALHLSPCFTPPRIVRNSLQNGAWGIEEAWDNGSLFSPHQPFEIMILTEPNQFKIAINGIHHSEFRHRIPYQHITHLTIDGDVDIERISITSSSPSYATPAYQPSAPPANTSVPYPTSNIGMPMPAVYPTLPNSSSGPPDYPPAAPYPSAGGMPVGPVPTGASYMSGGGGYPPATGPSLYPQNSPYPQMPGSYPQGSQHMGVPGPTPSGYQAGLNPQHQQPGHSSSSPFGNLPIGGKTLGTLAGVLKEGVYRKFPLARHFL